ncbi:carboxymuconolactone decarboxylase family protein [Sphingomonas sp. MMS24-J13]|uniref:carboxymuconolactone decarboxylase family protein n=1 Tax=Sphingomonas sp. MMS24-J13 TaxID=3238686 RepID=UPI00384D19A8
MRTNTPRLGPLTDAELDEEQEAIIAPFREVGADFGVSRAFVRHPAALKAFRVWATYVMIDRNPLPEREREILALRTAWLVKSGYVWSRHIPYGRKVGLTEDEMAALKRPIKERDWSEADAALIAAADALVAQHFIPDDIWTTLSAHFDDRQCMDAIFVVGHFVMLAMFLNTAGVPIDHDVTLDPDLDLRS